MYEVRFTTAYKKSYKLMKKRGLDLSLLDEVVDGIVSKERFAYFGFFISMV